MLLVPAGRASADTVPVSAATVTPLPGVSNVQLVSKSGRYVVADGRLRDLRTSRILRNLPGTPVSISDDGRYVTYAVPKKTATSVRGTPTHRWDHLQVSIKVYDRRTRKTRTATTARSGKAVKPAWRTPCVVGEDTCEEGLKLEWAPQLAGGQISGNGRWVAYCANYQTPDRADLYIKDMRTKRLAVRTGVCSPLDDYMNDRLQAPSISENGATVLLPGLRTTGEEGPGHWAPSKVLLNRSRVVEVGGYSPTMTHDGKTISIKGAFASYDSDAYVYDEGPVTWVHLGTGTATLASPTHLQLTMQNASRRGRYVAELDSPTYPDFRLTVRDRALGTVTDLTPAVNAAGYALRDSTYPAPILTGDGKTVFVQTQQGPWVAVRWMA